MEPILSAHEIGEGLPVLIIHGWKMEARVEELDFEPVFSKTPGLRRIYVDLPGMGATPANNVKDLDDIYLRLVQFIDSRLGRSRFLLVGSSCGAYLARAIAQKYIEQVDGLLLRVPLIEPKDSMRDLDAFKPLVANKQLMSDMSAEDKGLLGNVLVQTPAYVQNLKAKYEDVLLPAERKADSKVLDPIREDPHRYQLSFSLDNEGAKFFAPTLVICGRQDESVGYRDSLRLLELYPRSTYVVLDRGTHGLPIDETSVFEALVRDWITRVNEWRGRTDREVYGDSIDGR
ncbi:alpha/beta fold hydrolase [Aspergillus novofumigatus IBT 16806]|uniref:Putative alpha/beta fold family hydrolase n=1 Tax=Aspergillus novofumigatus (strain IBT 16806) TaxID=1392255 RepID=A0A2I1C4C6_ASPN1|nr:putative alpha/beta fold family hydrolase [Aspergillus novofumigatus IBT 16806]PKX92482.1 putative alpha/beta fold family hydrolase [Aspergillus novofumigatus IBT 16806]